jgi:hypothetical protein
MNEEKLTWSPNNDTCCLGLHCEVVHLLSVAMLVEDVVSGMSVMGMGVDGSSGRVMLWLAREYMCRSMH